MPTLLTYVLGTCIAYGIWGFLLRSSKQPLPPGPKGWPLIGNILEMPRKFEWLKFTEWARLYGDLVSVSVPGQTIIIINSVKEAVEMLDKKSRIYSDRPPFPMGELIGWQPGLAFLSYGTDHTRSRKIFRQVIGSNSAMERYHGMSEREVYRFLNLLLDKPEPDYLFDHIKRTARSLILRISSGYETKNGPDPLLSIIHRVTSEVEVAAAPGGFLVNYLPVLKHVPEWFPGAGFKHVAREMSKSLHEMLDGPYDFVRQGMAKGTAKPSVVYEFLKDKTNLSAEEVTDAKWIAQNFLVAGSDTTVSTLYGFFKAMVLYPEVQAKAQAEIDAVIGNDRLPTVADRDSLPYVSAVVTEALRWHVVLPNGLPHRAMEDDVHNGYFIPKGSIIFANIWNMIKNPDTYKDPSVFDPTRYIKTEGREPELDPRNIIFGFGRRICPGNFLADVSIFTACAMVLATFSVTAPIEYGEPVMPDVEQRSGLVSHPTRFEYKIVPRSDKAVSMIRAAVEAKDN